MALGRPRVSFSPVSTIKITSLGNHEYGVELTEGDVTSSHHVTVPSQLLDRWSISEADEESVVRESMQFLLEREPATSIMERFSLSVISRYFPEYEEELPRRLT